MPPMPAGQEQLHRRLALAVPIDGLGFRESLELAAGAGELELDRLISARFELDQINEALTALGSGSAVIEFA
jgi:hypothetical protein